MPIEELLLKYCEDPKDERLQRQLFRFYQKYVKAAVIRAGGKEQTYLDERVEIMYQLLRAIARHSLTNPRVVESYLGKVARSVTIKAEQRNRKHVHEPLGEVAETTDVQTHGQVDARFQLQELKDELPEEDWDLLELRIVHGLGFDEIATRLGIKSTAAVRKRWQRLRQRLRAKERGDK